jgi:hypothetical protein
MNEGVGGGGIPLKQERGEETEGGGDSLIMTLHGKKRVNDFPVPSRDVTNQTFPGQE